MRIHLPELALVFDCETTTDYTQRLLFGSYRLLDLRGKSHPVGACLMEGFFYDDDLPARDPEGWQILREYVAGHAPDLHEVRATAALALHSRREFVDRVFWRLGYKARALITGFNLPFDISRLAVQAFDARWDYEGGFSLVLWDYQDEEGEWQPDPQRPRIDIKSISSKQHLMQFTGRREPDAEDYDPYLKPVGKRTKTPFTGHFLDLRTLAFGLTDRNLSLERACEEFGVEHGKTKAEEHGKITPEYIYYNRRDVLATSELLVKLLEEHERHPIELQPTKVFSPASVAKGYLRAMGITAPLRRQDDFPDKVLGYAMNAFYGGRAEARIRRVALPVVYTDFASMYPSVNSLMGNADLLRARRIEAVEATDEVRAFVEQVTLEQCFEQETWPKLRALVKVRPHGEPFPVRARYDEHGQSSQIGSNLLTTTEPIWYGLPDVVAAKLLGGTVPEIVEAWRIVPKGTLRGLKATKLRGLVAIDPATDDFFCRVIEERKRAKGNKSLPKLERDRLDKALKVIANSGSYGIFGELNRKESGGKKKVRVDAWNVRGECFHVKVARPELPGEFCFPPLAALITAAARLMLALLECSVRERGGSYVCCDTDSMTIVASEHGGFIPCPGGPHGDASGAQAVKALSWGEVDEVIARFNALNPYDRSAVPDLLKIEDENFIAGTDTRRQLYGYAISAKRYVLYNLEGDALDIRKPLEHGLGYLMNPIDPKDDEDVKWIDEVWRYIVDRDVRGLKAAEPEWFSLPAISRIGVSSPDMLRLFDRKNRKRDYPDQVKPFNFMLSSQVAEFGFPLGVDEEHFHLVAPYERRPGRWLGLRWLDRHSLKSFRVTTDDQSSREGTARIKTFGDVVEGYRHHPEHKSLAPDGEPCGKASAGLLGRRPVEAKRLRYVGKESNRIELLAHGFIEDEDEVSNEYEDPSEDPFVQHVVPILREMRLTKTTLDELGVSRSTLTRVRAGEGTHRDHRRALTTAAVQHARDRMADAGVSVPHTNEDILRAYAEVLRRDRHVCRYCGRELESRRKQFCNSTCRSRYLRGRLASGQDAKLS